MYKSLKKKKDKIKRHIISNTIINMHTKFAMERLKQIIIHTHTHINICVLCMSIEY